MYTKVFRTLSSVAIGAALGATCMLATGCGTQEMQKDDTTSNSMIGTVADVVKEQAAELDTIDEAADNVAMTESGANAMPNPEDFEPWLDAMIGKNESESKEVRNIKDAYEDLKVSPSIKKDSEDMGLYFETR